MNTDDLRRVAAAAWKETKKPEQPEFDAVNGDYQTRLIGQVESVLRNGASDDAFEQAAKAAIEALQAAQNPPVDEPVVPVVGEEPTGGNSDGI